MATKNKQKTENRQETNYLQEIFSEQISEDTSNDTDLQRLFTEKATENWEKNSQQYRKLLADYVCNSEKTLKSKRRQKWWFFGIAMGLLLATTVFFGFAVYRVMGQDLETSSKMLETVPALVALLTPMFVIPKLIAKYLFNTKDEEHMIKIIEQIIKHDNNSLHR